MNPIQNQLALLLALSLTGAAAQASVIAPNQAGGSEAVATFVNLAGDSISQDLGDQMAGIQAGDSYALSASVLNFINSNGGPGGVSFGLIAGSSLTRTYLHSSASPTLALPADEGGLQVANSAKSLWASSLDLMIQNFNQNDATSAAVNNSYGVYPIGFGSPNYIDGLHDNWLSGDFQFSNTGVAADPLLLYTTTFATSNLGLVNFTAFKDGLTARLDLSSGTVQIAAAAVPAPAGVWLLGTALLPLARRALRKAHTQPA